MRLLDRDIGFEIEGATKRRLWGRMDVLPKFQGVLAFDFISQGTAELPHNFPSHAEADTDD